MIEINRLQKYFFNALLLSMVAIVMRTVGVSFNVYVADKIGSEAMGLLTLTSGIYGFAITLAASGINMATVRLVSAALPYGENAPAFDDKSYTCVRKILKNGLLYCLFFGILASILLFSFSTQISTYLLKDIRAVPALRIMSFTLVPIAISSMLNGYFYAVRRVYKNVITQFCEQGVKIIIVTALLLTIAPSGIEYACIAVVAGGAISEGACVIVSGLLYYFDRILNKPKNEKKDSDLKRGFYISNKSRKTGCESSTKIIPIALPVAISAYFRSALSTIEHLAIPWGLKKSGLNSASSLASYGILHGMVFPVLLFPSSVLGAFSSLLVPELSASMAKGDNKRIKRIVERVFGVSLLFALGVSGIFICFSKEIGSFLYSNSEAGEFIRLLAPLIPLMYLDGSVDAMLKGLGEQIYSMRVNIVDSLISVILIITLLPVFGIKGYVAVIFITELINTSFSILKLINITKIKAPIFKWVIKPLTSIIASTLITRFLFSFFIADAKGVIIAEIVLTIMIYLILSIISGAINKNDITLAKDLLCRKKQL